MKACFLPVDGAATSPEALTYRKAQSLAVALASQRIDHASLVECRRTDTADTVVFDVKVEIPNRRVYPIRRRERIAVTFRDDDTDMPKVEALRSDFPVVPHLNLHLQEYPRSICLSEERYEELKRTWTASRFVRWIREWLALNARGELHREEQRLEPLLVQYAGHIVLPPDLAENKREQLFVTGFVPGGSRPSFLLTHRSPPPARRQLLPIVVSVHHCQPRTHGVIHRCPTTLADVAEIARAAGLDLITELRRALPTWKDKSGDTQVVLVLVFPKTRIDGGATEEDHPWCFMTAQSVRQLGVNLGIWGNVDGSLGALIAVDDEKRGQDIAVHVLNPCFELIRETAARLNGIEGANDMKIVGVGVGALGSQVVMNLARSGFGRWTLIDPDRLMPHNLARHALDGDFVGHNKAEALSYSAGTTVFEGNVLKGVDADILRPGAKSEEVDAALSSADVIIDMAASVAVQRYLAREMKSVARRVCNFLTPSGADSVVLAEDVGRRFTLDALEMQYYRALLHEEDLTGHVEVLSGRERYARSCGDTTSAMPQDLVALHSAIFARNLKRVLSHEASFIGVWRTSANGSVRHIEVPTRRVTEFTREGWTVVMDDGLREHLSRCREDKLPNETGGVLLGSFDLERRVLYIVDTLPSPPDSDERADLFIRGCNGLHEAVADVDAKTGGMLEYVGEWHSHPSGARTRPSRYDIAAFAWLSDLMAKDGLPAVMMIVGDAGETSLFVGKMGRKASPIPECASAEVA